MAALFPPPSLSKLLLLWPTAFFHIPLRHTSIHQQSMRLRALVCITFFLLKLRLRSLLLHFPFACPLFPFHTCLVSTKIDTVGTFAAYRPVFPGRHNLFANRVLVRYLKHGVPRTGSQTALLAHPEAQNYGGRKAKEIALFGPPLCFGFEGVLKLLVFFLAFPLSLLCPPSLSIYPSIQLPFFFPLLYPPPMQKISEANIHPENFLPCPITPSLPMPASLPCGHRQMLGTSAVLSREIRARRSKTNQTTSSQRRHDYHRLKVRSGSATNRLRLPRPNRHNLPRSFHP